MHPGVEAEHETSVSSIEHQVPARKQDFAWRGDCYRIAGDHWKGPEEDRKRDLELVE